MFAPRPAEWSRANRRSRRESGDRTEHVEHRKFAMKLRQAARARLEALAAADPGCPAAALLEKERPRRDNEGPEPRKSA